MPVKPRIDSAPINLEFPSGLLSIDSHRHFPAPMNNSFPGVTSNLRWLICGLLFLATTLNYMDRQILSLLKPVLDDQLHWTNAQFGEINAAFQAAYAVGLFFFGWFIDRWGVKVGYFVSIVLWSLAACAHTLVFSIPGFVGARVFLGVSEAGNFPAAVKAVAQWFPKSERALATAILNSGANVGAMLAPVLVPWLVLTWSWHAPFLVVGVAGFVWAVLWWRVYASPRRYPGISPRELAWIEEAPAPLNQPPDVPTTDSRSGWRELLSHRQAWSFVVAKLLTDPVWYFLLVWLPDYFKKARGLDIKNSGHLLAITYLIITVLSLAGGWVPGYLVRRGWSVTRARKTSLLCFAAVPLCVMSLSQVGNWWAVLLIGLTGAAHQAWSANLFTTVSDMFPNRMVARLVGLGSTAGAVGSVLLSVYAGRLLDQFGAAGAGRSYGLLFGFCGCAYLVAFGLNHLLAPSFAPLKLRAA